MIVTSFSPLALRLRAPQCQVGRRSPLGEKQETLIDWFSFLHLQCGTTRCRFYVYCRSPPPSSHARFSPQFVFTVSNQRWRRGSPCWQPDWWEILAQMQPVRDWLQSCPFVDLQKISLQDHMSTKIFLYFWVIYKTSQECETVLTPQFLACGREVSKISLCLKFWSVRYTESCQGS